MILEGQTANQKLISDVKNFLASAGINQNDVTVSLVDAEAPETTFDLDNPDNDLKLFQIRVSVPYSKVSYTPVKHYHQQDLAAALTFRNGRAVSE
jgi:hypothetical protein